MTGLDGQRVYLDWNATAPLRPEARAAMLEAMDVVGNPSSVHAEGRAAKAIVEKARGQVAALVGCDAEKVVFNSGATEGAAAILSGLPVHCAEIEHDAVHAHKNGGMTFPVDQSGSVIAFSPYGESSDDLHDDLMFDGFDGTIACQSANSETGVVQNLSAHGGTLNVFCTWKWLNDLTQTIGKQQTEIDGTDLGAVIFSSHKIGGPKGVGALAEICWSYGARQETKGGGQEQGRRSGTENVIGIAGFGAAAEAAQRDLDAGVWEPIEKLRNILEDTLATAAPKTIFFGQDSPRLPNTSCFAVPGWKGETQVMQMDLAGFAVSAGSACSSGKVNKASRVLLAMGFDEETASSAIRVSMGPTTTEAEVTAFADAWISAYRRRESRAA